MFQSVRFAAKHCIVIPLVVLISACQLPSSGWGDVTVIEEQSKAGRYSMTVVYRFEITAAPEPVPAFKYRFTVEPHKKIPGNAATHYLNSFGERSLEGPWKRMREKYPDEVDHWYDFSVPLSQLPVEKVREASAAFDSYVRNHIQRASRCRDCDWGMGEEYMKGREAIEFLLPSVQQTREIARALRLRARLALAEGRFEDAAQEIRMAYQLGQDVGKMNFLVSNLVGISEVSIAQEAVVDWIAAPNSPNLYWTLAELPSPMIDVSYATRLDLSLGYRLVQDLENAATAKYSPSAWGEIYSNALFEMVRVQEYGRPESSKMKAEEYGWAPAALAAVSYPYAKTRLIEAGYSSAEVDSMAVGQVLMIAANQDFQIISSNIQKELYVPISQRRIFQFENEAGRPFQRVDKGLVNLLLQLTPAIVQVSAAQWRIERHKNALMLIEAIRMHVANTGSLPESLNDIKLVPVPNNPMTQQPFQYRLDGQTAIVELPTSDGVHTAYRFEITVAPTK